jgi:hypothetical protein
MLGFVDRFAGSIVVFAVVAVGVTSACLGSIPEATRCPADAVHSACPSLGPPVGPSASGPQPPAPAPTTSVCSVTTDTCLRAERSDCVCRPDLECTRSAATCYPPPDCPRSVTDVQSGATCVGSTATLTGVGPGSPPCACGCTSCAVACDGQGPVLGGNQTVRFDLGAPTTTARFGAMVRLRGSGRVTMVGRTVDGAEAPIGEASATPSNFSEVVVTAGAPSAPRPPIVAVELHTDAVANVEVDCVVPFYAR